MVSRRVNKYDEIYTHGEEVVWLAKLRSFVGRNAGYALYICMFLYFLSGFLTNSRANKENMEPGETMTITINKQE